LCGEPNLAHKYGMKCIVLDPRVSAAVDKPGPQTDCGLEEAVRQHACHPAFMGFYLMDEPGAGKFADLAHVNRYLLAKEPNGVPYINLFPTYANEQQLGTKTYEEHVERFMNEVGPRVLSYDHYALMKNGTERADYFRNMEVIRAAGLKYDVPYWFIFLITPHYGYRDPTEGDLRWQIYTALAYGYKGLVYFTYWSVKAEGFGESIIDLKGQRTHRYELAKKLNAEVHAIGPLLAGLRSTSVYHVAVKRPEGTRGPDDRSLVRNAEGGDLVIGELQDAQAGRYLFVTNASPRNAATVRLMLAEGVRVKGEIPRGREPTEKVVIKGKPPVMSLVLSAGEGRLFKVARRT